MIIGKHVVNIFVDYFVEEAKKDCVENKPVVSDNSNKLDESDELDESEPQKEKDVLINFSDEDEKFSKDISLNNEKDIIKLFDIVDYSSIFDRNDFLNTDEFSEIDEIQLSYLFYNLEFEKEKSYFFKNELLNKKNKRSI